MGGGKITVSSTPEKGTTFELFFPQVEAVIPSLLEIPRPSLSKGHERILLVDDEKSLIHIGQRMLERLGYKIIAKTSSAEALQCFRAEPDKFDLVVTDQTMPNLTGIQLTKELKKIRPDIPIILCTGFYEKTTGETIKRLGIAELLMKPVDIRKMAEAVRRALDGKKADEGMLKSDILIIDDDQTLCNFLSDAIRRKGHEPAYALNLKDGLARVKSGKFDVVFLDVRMPDGNGLEILEKIKKAPSSPEVIIITGEGNPKDAEFAIKNGAWDYVKKPSSVQAMITPLFRAIQYRQGKMAQKPFLPPKRHGIIGSSSKMKVCLDHLAQAAKSEANVLITGETGTGKELFAMAIHKNSPRRDKNFVVVDCAALPETLVESMLFGHEKGAFTGADKAKEGLITQAHGGTLFLDEIGELPLSIQKKFLRVLQEHRFRPIGSKKERESNFRLIAATNQDLDEMVKIDKFRNDLLFRLKSFPICLPPLRERPEDIKKLAVYHLNRFSRDYCKEAKAFSPEFFETLSAYNWPGNVRELVNTMERTLAEAGDEPILFPKHLPTNIRIKAAKDLVGKPSLDQRRGEENQTSFQSFLKLQDLRDSVEQKYLQDLVSYTEGNIKDACEISGMSQSRLYALFKKHNLFAPKRTHSKSASFDNIVS